jgi:ubiquinone biosynthesis protein UbiJ
MQRLGSSIEAVIESALNNYIALDPELPAKLEGFAGKVICLDIVGSGQKLYLAVHNRHIEVNSSYDHEPDVILRGSVMALFKMSLQRNVAPLLLKGEVEIIGNMRLGRAFKALLADMHIDWEEQLANRTGDVIAHELFKNARKFVDWGKRSAESITMDVSEYLQEESRDVVTAAELQTFYAAVDDLRTDTDRLQAKIDNMIATGNT